jgi:hypothetical protein
MGFLSPALLALAAAAAVPLLLHLLQRHQGPRVIFPALRYLRRAERESARRIRLRQLLLMLLRMGAIVLLALAAARPFAPGAGAAHEPTAVAIILDNSMSTSTIDGDVRVFDRLREQALQVLELASPEDRFWLVLPATPWHPARPGDATSTMERVRAAEPVAAAADLGAALRHASALLAAGAEGRAREIHLLSDQQAASFRQPVGAPGPDAPRIVAHLPSGRPPPNAAVTELQLGGGLAPVAGTRSPVVVMVAGTATDSVAVRLVIEERVVAAGFAPPAGAAVLMLPAQPPGLLLGHLEIEPDALRADDRRFFATRVAPPPTVALEGEASFVDHALDVLADSDRIRRAATAAASIVITAGGTGLDRIAPGRDLVVLPPLDAGGLAALNRRLQAAGIPWQYEPPVPGGEARFAPPAQERELARALEGVRVRLHFPLRSTVAPDTILLRMADGEPWAVVGERTGGGRYVLLASPIDPAASDLPASPAMLPLLDVVLARWLAPELETFEAQPGADLTLPAGADWVEHPDDIREPVAGDRVFRVPPVPGLYRVLAGDSVLAAAAVNPPPQESDLTRLDRNGLRGALQGWEVTLATTPADWQAAIFGARLGSELWRVFLLLALLFLLIEAFAATSGRRSRTTRLETEA